MDINLPPKPKKTQIAGWNKKKENQYWKRTPLLKDWDLISVKERQEFIKQEFTRRRDGYWFMNNGTSTYITGQHYYYLNWCKIDIGYPDYRDRDRRFFLFWDHCNTDPASYGMIMVKHRREGASWKGACIALNQITSNYNAHGGLLSKTGDDAKALFAKVVYMFRSLPEFFQPIIDGTDNPKSSLSFNTPGHRITKKINKVQKSEALNSKIDWKNTRENSYDSTKLKYFMCDEGGKWEEADVRKNWQIVKPCLSLGNKVIGKCFMPTTVNEMTRKGGTALKEIWDGSDPEYRDLNGRTVSGMYRYFTPAFDGLEGYIDKYGASITNMPKEPVEGIDGEMIYTGARTFLLNRREMLQKNTSALAEEKRQFPFTSDEAFRVNAKNCMFDAEKIHQQLDWLETLVRPMTTKGNFIWKGGIKDSEVIWAPNKHGKFRTCWLPDIEDCNKERTGRLGRKPGNDESIVAGCDPYDHDTTTDSRRSDAAAYVFKKYSPADPNNTHLFVCEYITRPPKAIIFYEDMIMMCKFYGCQLLAENNKIGVINHFNQRGYNHYLMDRPESTHTSNSRGQKTKGLPTSGQFVINAIADAIQAYVYDCVGIDEETGEIGRVYFDRLLKDWAGFEIENRTKYDATMASGMTLLAAQKHIKIIKHPPIFNFVREYNNKGQLSKIL